MALKAAFSNPGFPKAKDEKDRMQGSEVLKEFKELNERKVNEKLIETILRLWPCD